MQDLLINKSVCIVLHRRQLVACFYALRIVEFQEHRGGAAYRGQGHYSPAFGAKMFIPTICPRIEERHDRSAFRIYGSDVRSFETIALNAGQSEIVRNRRSSVLGCNNVIRFVRKEASRLRHSAIFAPSLGTVSNQTFEPRRDRRAAHFRPDTCFSTSALMRETNRSTSQISSSSASSCGVRAPASFRPRSFCARALARGDGRNFKISSRVGRRARNEMTSRRRPLELDQPRRNSRAMISFSRSRSGSNFRARSSGISMVNCIALSVAEAASSVKPAGSLP